MACSIELLKIYDKSFATKYPNWNIRLYSSDGRAKDYHPAPPGSIPASAKLKIRSQNITPMDGYILLDTSENV